MSAVASSRFRVDPIGTLREALAIYRVHWRGLVLAAVLVFGPLALLDAVLEDVEQDGGGVAVALAVTGQSLVHVVGDVFYAGVVAAAVIAWRSGRVRQTPADIARTLPWATIVALDILLPLATVAGLLLLVVPGVLVYVYFGLAPAFVKIEHLGVRAGLRRSAQAVRGNFWRVLAVYLLLVVTAGVAEELLQSMVDAFVGAALIHLGVEMLGAPFYGLATVLMAFALGARDSRPEGK